MDTWRENKEWAWELDVGIWRWDRLWYVMGKDSSSIMLTLDGVYDIQGSKAGYILALI